MLNVDKSQFSAVMTIIKENTWLSTRADKLTDLLLEDCSTKEEQDLVANLLSRFKYISAACFVDRLNDLVLDIITMPNIKPENTLIAAMAADSGPDSSQALVQTIKVKLQHHGWGGVQIVNVFGSAFKKMKAEDFSRQNIILVDEFIGSGRTVIGRVSQIKSQFKGAGVDVNVFVNVVFASNVGIKALKESGINCSYIEEVNRGISDFEAAENIDSKIKFMLGLEGKLSSEYGKYKLNEYSLGYGKAESLISIENANIPNNVFPIFWWPEYADGKIRNPLFSRHLGV